jgi:hypothetical protein
MKKVLTADSSHCYLGAAGINVVSRRSQGGLGWWLRHDGRTWHLATVSPWRLAADLQCCPRVGAAGQVLPWRVDGCQQKTWLEAVSNPMCWCCFPDPEPRAVVSQPISGAHLITISGAQPPEHDVSTSCGHPLPLSRLRTTPALHIWIGSEQSLTASLRGAGLQ